MLIHLIFIIMFCAEVCFLNVLHSTAKYELDFCFFTMLNLNKCQSRIHVKSATFFKYTQNYLGCHVILQSSRKLLEPLRKMPFGSMFGVSCG